MPIVTVNLSDAAYEHWKEWKKDMKGSRHISECICRYASRIVVVPELRSGDRRISVGGEELIWTVEGWVVDE